VSEGALDTPIALTDTTRALFTTRVGGNLSSRAGALREEAPSARERLRERIGLRSLAYTLQVHGACVRGVQGSSARGAASTAGAHADGQTSVMSGIGLMAFTADCLPVALGCEGAVAMLHAGWRGLAAGVLEEGIRALRAIGGRGEIVAVIGPGAGRCCYEVGEEVHAAFGNACRDHERLDLKGLARGRLQRAGVNDVRDLDLCTICDERFFSHRREGALAGRQVGVAWLR
jgi:polyphenol oxidase